MICALPETTQEVLDLVWPDIGSPMVNYWNDDQRFFAKRMAGACRLYEEFSIIYEQLASGQIEHPQAIRELALAAWGNDR